MSCPAKDWLEFFLIFYSSIYLLPAQFGWRKPGYVLSPYSRLSGCDDLFVLLLKSTFLATAYWPPNTIYRVKVFILPETGGMIVRTLVTKDSTGQHIGYFCRCPSVLVMVHAGAGTAGRD